LKLLPIPSSIGYIFKVRTLSFCQEAAVNLTDHAESRDTSLAAAFQEMKNGKEDNSKSYEIIWNPIHHHTESFEVRQQLRSKPWKATSF